MHCTDHRAPRLNQLQEMISCIINSPQYYEWKIISHTDKHTKKKQSPLRLCHWTCASPRLPCQLWVYFVLSLSLVHFLDRWHTSRLHNAASYLLQTHNQTHTRSPTVNTFTQLLLCQSYATQFCLRPALGFEKARLYLYTHSPHTAAATLTKLCICNFNLIVSFWSNGGLFSKVSAQFYMHHEVHIAWNMVATRASVPQRFGAYI